MARVLETFGGTPEGSEPYLQLTQLEAGDSALYAPLLGEVHRSAWAVRYAHELGVATRDDIAVAFSDTAIKGRMADIAYSDQAPATYLAAEAVYPARGVGLVVGYIRTACYTPPGMHPSYPVIKDFNVLPGYSGYGIGGMLLDRALSQFPEDRPVWTTVHTANHKVLHWLTRLGFEWQTRSRAVEEVGSVVLRQVYLKAESVWMVRNGLIPPLLLGHYGVAGTDPRVEAQNT